MEKSEAKFRDFIGVLEDAGYEPRAYSGRGMYGKECVAISGDDLSVWDVAREIFSQETDFVIPSPRQDALGRGIVLYWPSFEWPKEEV